MSACVKLDKKLMYMAALDENQLHQKYKVSLHAMLYIYVGWVLKMCTKKEIKKLIAFFFLLQNQHPSIQLLWGKLRVT